MITLWQDIRYALRMLGNKPAFTLVAVLTLAMGIGATSAVFSVVDRILFRSLPYPHDEQLVSFGLIAPIESREFMLATDYVAWRAAQTPFESVTTFTPGGADCDLTEKNPIRLSCALVESSFLPTFGLRPILGRNFTKEEDVPSGPRVALLSYGLWKSRFAGDRDIVGKAMSLDGQPTVVVGVLPPEFEMPTLGKADLLLAQRLDEAGLHRDTPQLFLRAFGRLKPGVTIERARAALQPLFEQSLPYVPAAFRKEVRLSVRSLRDRQIQDSKAASWILLGAVLGVLLVACTNVANLLLARATARQRELAVRAALGASRGRLVRQALTESLLLGLIGGTAGCWVAYLLLKLFESIAPEGIPRLEQASVDLRVLTFTLAISLASGVLFGLAPAISRFSENLLSGREARQTTRGILRQILVASQLGVSLILLTGAGLLLRSLWKLERVPLGMDTQSVIEAQIALADYRYTKAKQQVAFFDELVSRLKQLPGIVAVAVSDTLPPSGGVQATIYSQIEIPGRPRSAEGTGGTVSWRSVTPGYFSALGIAIPLGRGFQDSDQLPSENPIILSESLAHRLFPNGDALGKTMRFGREGPWRTVVGIAANVRNNGAALPSDPEFYIPWKVDSQGYFRVAHVILRTPLSTATVSQWLREETAKLDPTAPVTIETMSQRVGKLSERPRFSAILLTIFGSLGALLAAIGMYGVVSFLVAQRTQEIGVRIALGATPSRILRMVMTGVAKWAGAGALLGIVGSWFGARLLETLLFQVSARDPWPLGTALVLLLGAALFAAWIPAQRAMRIEPVEALRYE